MTTWADYSEECERELLRLKLYPDWEAFPLANEPRAMALRIYKEWLYIPDAHALCRHLQQNSADVDESILLNMIQLFYACDWEGILELAIVAKA